MLILTEADVGALYSDQAAMHDAISAIAMAHREWAEGRVVLAPRAELSYPRMGPDQRRVQIDSGVLGAADFCVARLLGVSRGMSSLPRERQAYVLWRQSDTSLIALIACEWANVVRTGAATALATDLHRDLFSRDMRDPLGVHVVSVRSAEEALEGADIVCGSTFRPTSIPIQGRWVRNGAHVNSIGLWNELDLALVARGRLVVSTREGVFRAIPPAEPCATMLRDRRLREEDVAELTEIVVGKRTVRRLTDDTTLFVSAGTPLWDAAVAWRIYSLAREWGVGRELSLLDQ